MLWKLLSGLAALALAVGVWFSKETKNALVAEKELATRAASNLKETQDRLASGGQKKTARETELAEATKQRDALNDDVTRIVSDADAKKKEADSIKTNLDEVTKQLSALQKQIDDAGDIKKLLAKVDELNNQKKAADAAISNQQQQLALADVKLVKVNAEITRLNEVDARQRSGAVEPGFTARITEPYTGFGFVILNKGNLGGMFANAMLDVRRGTRVVAKLKVRDVEQSMSVADLVPGTLAQGESIRSGDLVVAAKVPPPPPVVAPVAAPGAEPMAPGAPADPFGAPMAAPTPEAPAAPATPDPFGAPGGMAPAPAAPAAPEAPAAPGAPATPPTTPDPFAPPAQN